MLAIDNDLWQTFIISFLFLVMFRSTSVWICKIMSVLLIFYTYLYIIYNACIISLLNAICIWYVNHVSTYGLETKKSFEVGHCLCFIITSCGPMHMPPIASFLGIVIDWWHLASNSICSFADSVILFYFWYTNTNVFTYVGFWTWFSPKTVFIGEPIISISRFI